MTDGDALLRAVLAAPDDDGVRLIYADWLDENGEPERAEFIRVQCELAKLPEIGYQTIGPLFGKGDHADYEWGRCARCARSSERCPYHRLWIRAQALQRMSLGWSHPFVGGYDWFHRGFAERFTCSAADWLQHADAITAAHPVREVRLTTWPDGWFDWPWVDPNDHSRGNTWDRFPGIIFHPPPPDPRLREGTGATLSRNVGTYEQPDWQPLFPG